MLLLLYIIIYVINRNLVFFTDVIYMTISRNHCIISTLDEYKPREIPASDSVC